MREARPIKVTHCPPTGFLSAPALRAPARKVAPTAPTPAASTATAPGPVQSHAAVDLARHPADPALLKEIAADQVLEHRLLPWRRAGQVTTYVSDRPAAAAAGLRAMGVRPGLARVASVDRSALDRAIIENLAERHLGR